MCGCYYSYDLSYVRRSLVQPVAAIGVNAAGITGIRTPPIFDLQGSVKALDPCYNSYTITREGGEGKNERGGPPQYLKCIDAYGSCCVPAPTQPAIPSWLVNEYQWKLGSKRAYHAMHNWPCGLAASAGVQLSPTWNGNQCHHMGL